MRNQSNNSRARFNGRNNNRNHNSGMVRVDIPTQLRDSIRDLENSKFPKVRLRYVFGEYYSTARVLVVQHPEGDVTISTCVLPRERTRERGTYHSGGVTLALNPHHLGEGDSYGVISIHKTPAGIWFVDNSVAEVDDRHAGIKHGSRYKNWFPPIRNCPNNKWLKELSAFTGLDFRVNEQLLFQDYQGMTIGEFHDYMKVVDDQVQAAREAMTAEEVQDMENVHVFSQVLAGAEEPVVTSGGVVTGPPEDLRSLIVTPEKVEPVEFEALSL